MTKGSGLAALTAMTFTGIAADDLQVLTSTMQSTVLGEERQIIVHLPESYGQDRDRRYPAVYVLDGTSQDGHTAATATRLARAGVMPEVIVVGLPNTRGNRNRDYTPPSCAWMSRNQTARAAEAIGFSRSSRKS